MRLACKLAISADFKDWLKKNLLWIIKQNKKIKIKVRNKMTI